MKLIIVWYLVVLTIFTVNSLHEIIEEGWDLFKFQFKKVYSSVEEDSFRKIIYWNNKVKIDKHNQLYERDLVTYSLELNNFGDLTQFEYSAMVNGFKHSLAAKVRNDSDVNIYVKIENIYISTSIDWSKQGYVTPIKNQGSCGSCWSFSTTGSLEGQHFRKTGELVSFSEQNLIDCSSTYGNNGCDGGFMNLAFKYIKENKGLDTEQSYPYEAKTGQCRYNLENSGAVNTGFVIIPEGDEDILKDAVSTVGPVSIAIDASSYKFQFYKEGIYFNPDECSSKILNHAALVVGYSTNDKGDYWIVKNSWGTTWGEQGYVLMARNKNNHCGITTSASYPIV